MLEISRGTTELRSASLSIAHLLYHAVLMFEPQFWSTGVESVCLRCVTVNRAGRRCSSLEMYPKI